MAWTSCLRGLLLLPLLSGCAASRVPERAPARAPMRDHASRPLVAPSVVGERAANQVVRGAFAAREVTLNCVVTVRGELLTVVGLTAMGVRAFTLRYDGREVQVENSLPAPAELTPERLLADIQLVYWPLKQLQSTLSSAGWRVSEPASHTRRLKRGDALVAEVHYVGDPWTGRSWLVNLQHGYTLAIESSALGAK